VEYIDTYIIRRVAETLKPCRFVGAALEDLKELPEDARSEAGHQLFRVQSGLEPDNWKPLATIGP